jgi:hypothetical protein
MNMLYIDTSDLGVEWLEELRVRTKVSGLNPSTTWKNRVELEQLLRTMELELQQGGLLGLKQIFLLFFSLFLKFLKIQIIVSR